MLNATIRFFLENKPVAWLLLLLFAGWGLVTAPFDFELNGLPRDPVAVDGAKLEQRIDAVEGDQIDPEGSEDLFEGDLELPEPPGVRMSRNKEDPDVQVRALAVDDIATKTAQTIIRAGPEQVHRQQAMVETPLIIAGRWRPYRANREAIVVIRLRPPGQPRTADCGSLPTGVRPDP